MFSVSNDYLTAIRSNVRRTKIRGFVDNVTVFTESNVEVDSFVINESFLGSDLSIGNTQSADMSVNVVGESSIAIGDEIAVEWGIQIHSEPVQYEWVPLGVFVVDNIEKVGSVSKISAFDKMVYFEKDINLPDSQSRTPYNWLIYACQECGVSFGMTAEEVNALPNYAAYGVPIDDKLRTYRNLISQLCIISGCNAIINRSGELVLIPLEIKEPVYNITNNEIVFDTLMVEDYTVQITGVFFVAPSGNRYGIISGNGKKIEISDLPMIEDQTETSYTNISRQIVHLIKCYSYNPYEMEWIGNPALDLGDWITINNSTTVITGRTIKFGNVEKLEAVGTLDKTKVSDSKTPTENAVDILRIKSLLNSTYATKEYVDNMMSGMYPTNTIHFEETATGFDLTIQGSTNNFMVQKDSDGRIIKIRNQTLNYDVWEGEWLNNE